MLVFEWAIFYQASLRHLLFNELLACCLMNPLATCDRYHFKTPEVLAYGFVDQPNSSTDGKTPFVEE